MTADGLLIWLSLTAFMLAGIAFGAGWVLALVDVFRTPIKRFRFGEPERLAWLTAVILVTTTWFPIAFLIWFLVGRRLRRPEDPDSSES